MESQKMLCCEFVRTLLTWGMGRRAELPWRATRDPWSVLVAEIMLQQTQTARVAPRYHDFLATFPNPAACATAPPGEVLRRWEGLGYNRRAVSLHRAAQVIVERHGGAVPDALDALLALPGVGPYTARAVRSLAFGHDCGVLDTNAARVLARALAGRRLSQGEAQSLADSIVPPGRSRDWNQAVMDLGSGVCTRKGPRCGDCPVLHLCAWAATGWQQPDPADGTAGSSVPQSPFAGSDRQGRGRLVQALRAGPLPLDQAPQASGWAQDPERAHRVVDALIAEGLAEHRDGVLRLPSSGRAD
ncbi:MAG: A/G-specific adenine glycosylase [Actinomycetota bacterium]|nr:A/G-specific adenine glycosylase [Actinomycetota bacterium]